MKGLGVRGVSGAAMLIAVVAGAGCKKPPAEPSAAAIVIQVRPFDVIEQEEGADYVGRAFAESLALGLAESPQLEVLPVEGSAEPPESSAPAAATRTISGRLAREGGSVRGELHLVDSSTDATLWDTELTSELGELSELASLMARGMIERLNVSEGHLYPYIVNVTGGPRMAASDEAKRAWQAWRNNDTAGFLEATSRLVDEFGDDPAAHVLNAWALTQSWDADPSAELLALLKERLVALDQVDPSSPYDELMLGYVYRSSGEPGQARVLYTRVLDRSDLTHTARSWALRQRSFTYLQVGNAAAASDDSEKALQLDPANARSLIALSKALEAMDRLDDAIEAARRALLLEPHRWRHHQRRGIAASRAGRVDEAVESLEQACDLSDNQEPCANLAVALRKGGRLDRAREALVYAEGLTGNRWGAYNLGCYYALAGNPKKALAALARASELGFADVLIETDPDLASLHGNPGFRSILQQVQQRLQSRRQQSVTVFPWQT